MSAIGSAVDIYFDRELGRMYFALNVTAGSGPNDGVRAVMVGSIAQGRLMLSPIAPDSAFPMIKSLVLEDLELPRLSLRCARCKRELIFGILS